MRPNVLIFLTWPAARSFAVLRGILLSQSVWQGSPTTDAIWGLLDTMLGILKPGGLVAIASDKHQTTIHAGYERLVRFQVGKRRVAILRPNAKSHML